MIARHSGGLFVLAFLAASMTSAHAEDVTMGELVTVSEIGTYGPGAYDPSGFHAGTIVGYKGGDTSWSFTGLNKLDEPDFAGGTGGVIVGYSKIMNQIIVVVEGDIPYSNAQGDPRCQSFTSYTCEVDMDRFGTLRAIAGIPYKRSMFYVSGGLAGAHVSSNINLASTGAGALSSDDFHWGWTFGVGVDVSVRENISLRTEALFYDMGEQSFTSTIGGTSATSNVDLSGYQIRAALIFRIP